LFPPKGIVHIVTAECENSYFTEIKKGKCPHPKPVHGFRMDIRLVVEVEEEIDVAVGK
ncbi:hypothetical protein J3Q64DRAFT_1620177, partial [Phycomyces blakesleeanus]